MSTDPTPITLSADAPIRDLGEDEFERERLARRIAAEARAAPPDSGLVIALCGPWGSGKTSIGNMIRSVLAEDDPTGVLWMPFNPWMFAGTEDLVGRFFRELAVTIGKQDSRFKAVAVTLGRYAGALAGAAKLIPVAGDPASVAMAAVENVAGAAGHGATLDERREELMESLEKIDGRIVVFLDDLDRLSDQEIQEIVRLVKLVGDLPRITYILSFDHRRVEEALGAPGQKPKQARARGRAYLEKVVQSRHDVPPLRQMTLVNFMANQIDAAIAPYEVSFDPESNWTNMVVLGVRQMLRTPRDARRIANAMPAALELYGDEVAAVDLFGLQVLRVLEPDVHAALPSIAEILTDDRFSLQDTLDDDRRRLAEVLDHAREPEAVKVVLGQLFPHAPQRLLPVRGHRDAQEERKAKRVAGPPVFRAYLHLALDDDRLPAADVEGLGEALADAKAFSAKLDAVPDELLPDAIVRLLNYRERFEPSAAVDIADALLSVRRKLPPDASPFLTGRYPASEQLRVLVGQLLLSETDSDQRGENVQQIVERARTLSDRLELVSWFGTFPSREKRDQDAEMLSEQKTDELLIDLRRKIAESDPGALVAEPELSNLLRGLIGVEEEAAQAAIAAVRGHAADDEFMLALVRGFTREVRTRVDGEAAVHRFPKIDVDGLKRLLGDEVLGTRLQELERALDGDSLDDETRTALGHALGVVRGDIDQSAL